jgi:acyl-CoA synthetase (AMP-forming)/AMP-acid ligase II
VLECAAYGVPDEKWGEAVAASVVLAPGSSHDTDSIRNDVRALIAAYKIPEHIEFPAALPRNTSGKVLRRDLRKRVAGRIGSGTEKSYQEEGGHGHPEA